MSTYNDQFSIMQPRKIRQGFSQRWDDGSQQLENMDSCLVGLSLSPPLNPAFIQVTTLLPRLLLIEFFTDIYNSLYI